MRWKLPDGRVLNLITPQELLSVPDGTELVAIDGDTVVKGRDKIDGDTRNGCLAFGFVVEQPVSSAPTPRSPAERASGPIADAFRHATGLAAPWQLPADASPDEWADRWRQYDAWLATQPPTPAGKPDEWYASMDGEHYHDGPYASAEEAAEGVVHGYDLQPGDTFWVGRAGVLDLTMSVADTLIDQAVGQIQDEVGGDYADDSFLGITKEMEQDLDDAINREFQAWMDRHGVRPTCFPIIDEKEHVVPVAAERAS